MTLWRKARTEAAGAWRSVRYDLSRPQPNAHRPDASSRDPRPEVTSTGFHTFGGADLTGERLVPRPRRLVAVSAFGVLAVAGAAGSYFAVVNGLGGLVDGQPAGAEPYPLAAEAPRGTEGELANSGLGKGTAHSAGRAPAAPGPAAEPAPGAIRVLPTTTTAAPVPPRVTAPRPRLTTVGADPETQPTGCCANPPVPTPTAPVPTPQSPSATPSPAASSTDSSASPEPSESPSPAPPSGSGDASTAEAENRVRHARRY
ncbi:hypothetical protein [Actinoplanes sp. NPDC049599]|uniref:hypothetical protein n=1 Tax=Actinoplanes sp. NPDC049599 TaxID=3363903 RepID=UPI0037982B47